MSPGLYLSGALGGGKEVLLQCAEDEMSLNGNYGSLRFVS